MNVFIGNSCFFKKKTYVVITFKFFYIFQYKVQTILFQVKTFLYRICCRVLLEIVIRRPPTLIRRTSVKENILFPRVTVKVAKQEDLFLQNLFDETEQTFRVEDLRMDQLVGIAPPTVQVLTRQAASVTENERNQISSISVTYIN